MVGAQLAGPIWESNTDFLIWFAGAILLFIGSAALTVFAVMRAAQRGDTIWVIAIIGGFFVGLGWILALVYLLVVRAQSSQRTPLEMTATPTARFCIQCGKALVSGARFCMECGMPVHAQTYRPFR